MAEGWAKVKKAAQYAGISERTLWSWLAEGLPHAKVNGTTLINYRDLEAHIRKHMVQRDRLGKMVSDVLQSLEKSG